MPSVIDLWRAVDPEARLGSGSVEWLTRPIRGVARTRASAPHFPAMPAGQLLVLDAAILSDPRLDLLIDALRAAELEPSAVWIAGGPGSIEASGSDLPVLTGAGSAAAVAVAASRYLDAEPAHLAVVAADVRLAGAEASLVDPRPSAPAGVLATRLRRGVAVTLDGGLVSLNARTAGRALATRFSAAHARLLGERGASAGASRRTRDGLWILDRPIGPGATAWLFDDLPFARIDAVALEALAVTLRALLRRRPAETANARPASSLPPSTGDVLRDTLIAVARANGRMAPAARSLGVHRNTVLYRLRRASTELGIDPRRPADALRLLREQDRPE